MDLVNGLKTLISLNLTIMRDNMLMKRKMVKEHSHGKMEVLTTEIT